LFRPLIYDRIIYLYAEIIEDFDKPLISTYYLYTLYKQLAKKLGLSKPSIYFYSEIICFYLEIIDFYAVIIDFYAVIIDFYAVIIDFYARLWIFL